MCWYEVQHRLSLHAHTILWLHKNDLNHVTNDVLAFVHTIYDETQKSFVEPLDPIENKLFKQIYRKQLHNCQKNLITLNMVTNMVSHTLQTNKTMNKLNYYSDRWEYFLLTL
jgi:hypothetical protein